MTHSAKPVLMIVGAILIALFPFSRWIAAEFLRKLPRVYFSAAVVEIKPVSSDHLENAQAIAAGWVVPRNLTVEIERIKSPEILDPAIERLDLVKKLSPEGMTMPVRWVTATLSRSIIVQQQDTTLVEIGVYQADAQLAADIANTVAVTYRDQRITDMRKQEKLALAELKEELETKREERDRLFRETLQIRLETKIVDADPDDPNGAISFRSSSSSSLEHPSNAKSLLQRYADKKSAYLICKQLVASMQQRFILARFGSGDSVPPVKIWERARPGEMPAVPDAVLIHRRSNGIGGSLGAVGWLLILIALRIKSPVTANMHASTNADNED